MYIPREKIETTSDVNMFLTRHRLLHTSVPRVPMSISHCWINTELERAKLTHGDHGYKDPVVPIPIEVSPPSSNILTLSKEIPNKQEVEDKKTLTEDILPDIFKTKSNLDRKASEPADHESLNSETSTSQPPTATSTPPPGKVTSNDTSQPAGGTARLRRKSTSNVVLLKDRDWRGEEEGGTMWWECQWEGMDGIGGTNKKGRKCFDRVRIWWRDLPEESEEEV